MAGSQEQNGYKTGQIVLLVLLLLFCLPIGICYAAWLIAGKKGLFIGCGCLSLPLLLVLLYIWSVSLPAEIGEHVPKVDWLSEDASDISFYRSYSWTAYEFKISEKSFLKQANPLWKFEEIRKPVEVPRYLFRLKKSSAYPDEGSFYRNTHVTVKNGLKAEERYRNGGGYLAAYDRDSGKAYIQSNPR